MTNLRCRGPAWTLGSDVDTDQIVSGRFLNAPLDEQSRHVFESVAPDFGRAFRPGGIVVAGANFGCGSSRESAPEVLQYVGVAAVVAESFARIFFRNAIAIGLPVLACPGVSHAIAHGDEVDVDVANARVTVARTGTVLRAPPLHAAMLECLAKGGIMRTLAEACGAP